MRRMIEILKYVMYGFHLSSEYKYVVVKPKFRPQSARIMVDESFQNLYLKNQNVCSIIGTGNFV